ncbi:MAG TPA: hypothetical protein PLW68_15895 [Casimicrobiaceae bacterium]|nr:hypothetical protein [Casimicrobiaceae bacterium]
MNIIVPPPVDDAPVIVTFFDSATREIRHVYRGQKSTVPENCPTGCEWVEGAFDRDEFSIDPAQPLAVRRQDSDIEARRGAVRAAVIVAAMKADILRLEQSQPRIIRERDLGDMTVLEARQRLRDINDQIVALRAIIQANS